MGKKEGVIDRIREILNKDNRGLTIQELADKVKVSRITASIALANLTGAGELDVRVIGNCKLHYVRNSVPKHPKNPKNKKEDFFDLRGK